ncbi:MAG: 6,7-dimethyl-8-ribityllumazine synthase [Euryarchaeota archaeon]|nr:6,7-dimethyl-8-ribityllumazine synthase [Euryarchaeota archaeon]MCD6158258.1 6,7-dimethyl-8-ribityllumazine synthase [Euryarchaeota archaeon]
MPRMRIGIVVSEYNYDITYMMLQVALEHARLLDIEVREIVKAPGVFDIPLVVKKLLKRKDIDGVVTLGAVLEGETKHDEIVMHNAARKIADLALEFEKPVTLGISGHGMTRLQAMERIEEKAKEAVEAVLKLYERIKSIEELSGDEQ